MTHRMAGGRNRRGDIHGDALDREISSPANPRHHPGRNPVISRTRCVSALGLAALGLLAACSSGDGPGAGPDGTPAIRFMAGNSQTDTAFATLAAPLVFKVLDASGHPAPNVSVLVGQQPCTIACLVGPIPAGQTEPLPSLTLTTDAQGRISVQLGFGPVAGAARLPISVPSLELTDTARFTVTPASAFELAVTPSDTAVYVGGHYTVQAAVRDRFGNPRPDPVSLQVATGTLISLDGQQQVTGLDFGRGRLTATAGGRSATASVSVVPRGTLANSAFGTQSRIDLMGLDGSSKRTLVPTGVLQGGAASWSPDGQTIVYQVALGAGSSRLRRIPAGGGTAAELVPAGAPFQECDDAQYSVDGAWVYFHAYTASVAGEIWRIHPDGTGLERVGPAGNPTTGDYHPTPSPDGTRVAYVSDRGHPGVLTLRVLTLSTGTEVDLAIRGTFPRWAPAGDWIALWKDKTIAIVHPDGSGLRQLSQPGVEYIPEGLTWSPDGAWVLGTEAGMQSLIRLADGLTLPLPFTNMYIYPAWHVP
ncbi:MAG TPA: hypothetical protein VFS40_05205 [Gemmatimonadales bacterium]|nr:hypothetical protein [Gemmatimonadales bacterium]